MNGKSETWKEEKPILGCLIKVTAVRNGGSIPPQIRENDHPEEEEVRGFIH